VKPTSLAAVLLIAAASFADEKPHWLLGHASKLPSQYTNQESGYFSIVEGLNGRLYIGAAKYGVNAYLLEYDPKTDSTKMVVDAHQVIGTDAKGFAAQSKFHTRNNVGASGKIYIGTKQGYPEKGESRDLYLGGYPMAYDPATGKTEHFGIAKAKHGIISVTPDESRGLIYVSTCSDDRPIDHSHFMVYNRKDKKYTDFGDMEHSYAFIVIDHKGRAYHPIRGGTIARYDPDAKKLERLNVTVDGKAAPKELTKDGAILNWEVSPDRKTLYAVEMSTNQLYSFDLTADGEAIPGMSLGALLPAEKHTDCRAMCVGPDNVVWAAVTVKQAAGGLHLVSRSPGKPPRDHGSVGVANPDFTTFTDAAGKDKLWHHTMPKAPDGTRAPWVPMGICAMRDGSVYVLTIAPFTVIRFERKQLTE
jgi:sugar lactone lactonase YvrE